MEYLIEDIVDAETLRQARREYEETESSGTSNERSQSQYGSCLVRCRSNVDIRRGVSLLNDLLARTDDPQTKRDCLYYLAIGYTKQEKYEDALICTAQLLRMDSYNQQFQEWKEYLNRKIVTGNLAEAGAAVGGVALGLGLLYGAYKVGEFLFSNQEEAPVPNRRAVIDEISSSDEESEILCKAQNAPLVGRDFNQWKRPEANYGNCYSEWLENVKTSPYVGEMDIGRRQWNRACNAVDEVKRRVKSAMIDRAQSSYKELKIDSYILQGSARDGLKVIAPDEFDVGFEFHIEGIHLEECSIMKDGRKIPGFCYLKVTDPASTVEKKCPNLWKKGIFIMEGGNLYLSSKMLHRSVFQSLIDQSTKEVQEQIMQDGGFDFKITRKSNPPAVNITITFDEEANDYFLREGRRQPADFTNEIDVDIIPALRLKIDKESACCGQVVNAPIHAICKWKEEESPKAMEIAKQNLVWLINSVAYERFVFDIARDDDNEKQQYILTALRILKTYMTKVKVGEMRKVPPPQIATVLQSYHLKQLTCYLILYTCYVYPTIQINGAQRALVFLIGLLEKCLETEKLPHFFYSNSKIGHMFHNYPYEVYDDTLRFNMLRKIPPDSKRQALLSLRKDLKHDLNIDGDSSDFELSLVIKEFNREVAHGEYF